MDQPMYWQNLFRWASRRLCNFPFLRVPDTISAVWARLCDSCHVKVRVFSDKSWSHCYYYFIIISSSSSMKCVVPVADGCTCDYSATARKWRGKHTDTCVPIQTGASRRVGRRQIEPRSAFRERSIPRVSRKHHWWFVLTRCCCWCRFVS